MMELQEFEHAVRPFNAEIERLRTRNVELETDCREIHEFYKSFGDSLIKFVKQEVEQLHVQLEKNITGEMEMEPASGKEPLAEIHPHNVRIENTSCTHTLLVEQHGHVVLFLEPRTGAEVELDTGVPILILGACEEDQGEG